MTLGEPAIRTAAFACVFIGMALWEAIAPRRRLAYPRRSRWPSNLGVVILDALALRALFPLALVGVAETVSAQGWGLLNWAGAPAWLAVPVSLLALDLVIWAQHVAFHRIPMLWRVHRMHHADLDFDVTTALRFHPVEIVLSTLIKMAAVVILGVPVVAVVAFEILLNAAAMFNHSNASLPARIEPFVRGVVVTPDMHRVHHSVVPAETHSNFGFCLSIWDRIAGLYRAAPTGGQDDMTIGLPVFREAGELRLDRMLTQPFRGATKR